MLISICDSQKSLHVDRLKFLNDKVLWPTFPPFWFLVCASVDLHPLKYASFSACSEPSRRDLCQHDKWSEQWEVGLCFCLACQDGVPRKASYSRLRPVAVLNFGLRRHVPASNNPRLWTHWLFCEIFCVVHCLIDFTELFLEVQLELRQV